MKRKISITLLGIYDLFLALFAIYTGILMITAKGTFGEYPKEWLTELPFGSWFIPGILAIVVFGLGNIIASIFSFRNTGKSSWLVSAIMGCILFISLICQVVILREWYLPTIEFMVISIIQLFLSRYCFTQK